MSMEEAQRNRRFTPIPEKHPASRLSDTGSVNTANITKSRQRGIGLVTWNACTNCRNKRAKCNGQQPCERCKKHKIVDCIYEVPMRQPKEGLRNNIKDLRSRHERNRRVISALTQPQLWKNVLLRLRGGQSVDDISDWLGDVSLTANTLTNPRVLGLKTFTHTALQPDRCGSKGLPGGGIESQEVPPMPTQHHHQVCNRWQNRDSKRPATYRKTGSRMHNKQSRSEATQVSQVSPQPTAQESLSFTLQSRAATQALAPFKFQEMKIPASIWTNVSVSSELVEHLLALYFCWEYPTFACLSKEHFLKDFGEGRHRYCSPTLVNALLALGCRFTNEPKTRTTSHDLYTSGDYFFLESLRLLRQEYNHPTLTTVQTLCILSIREASCGRASESSFYAGQGVRIAREMGLHSPPDDINEDELAVLSATFWGVFALDQIWSLIAGSLPQCSSFTCMPPKPAIINTAEMALWSPYTGESMGSLSDSFHHSREQPSFVQSVYVCFCELNELIHHSIFTLQSPTNAITSRNLLEIYTQFLSWYEQIPLRLQLGHSYTPAVLFIYMYYHLALLLLFKPFMKLRILGSEIIPSDICAQAANALLSISQSYSELYTLRRTPTFVPQFVLNSTMTFVILCAHDKSPGTLAGASDVLNPKASEATQTRLSENSASISWSPGAQRNINIRQAIRDGVANLLEMKNYHGSAEQAIQALRQLADKLKVDVDVVWPDAGSRTRVAT